MIIESIFLAIFVFSLGGIILILARKLPLLNSLPQNGSADIRKHHIILNIEKRVRDVFVIFEKQILLHKFLSWTKVMVLKIETQIDVLLHKIRRKAQEVEKVKREKK